MLVSLTSVAKIKSFARHRRNYVILIGHRQMPTCLSTEFSMVHLAQYIHPSNGDAGATPITLAKADTGRFNNGADLKDVEEVFKTHDDYDRLIKQLPLLVVRNGAETVVIPDAAQRGYDESQLLDVMAHVFKDESLRPVDYNGLESIMSNPDPDFVFFYSEGDALVPRFTSLFRPIQRMIDVREGNAALTDWFLKHPDVAARGLAVSVLKMDRPDLKIATIFDRRENKEYSFRFAQVWIDKHAGE